MPPSPLSFERFSHVSIVVADLSKAKAFYGNLIGLRELPRPNFSFPGAWYSLGANVELHIIVKEATLETTQRPTPFTVRYPHLALWVTDADATYEELMKRSNRVETVLTGTGYRQVYIFDDDDNLVEFMGPTKSGSQAR